MSEPAACTRTTPRHTAPSPFPFLSGLRRMGGSLFLRLSLVTAGTALAIGIANHALTLRMLGEGDTAIHRNMVQYVRYLVRELGDPTRPDFPDRARGLAGRLHMRITRESPGGTEQIWGAADIPGPFPDYLHPWFSADGVEASSVHGFHRIRVGGEDGARLTFDLYPTETERATQRLFAWYSMAVCAGFTLLAALALRHLLRPVRWLTEGAATVRDGDLGHRVPETRGGELRELSRTFNQMVDGVQRALDDRQRMVLDVAHELRTPITRLKLQLEMLPCTGCRQKPLEAGPDGRRTDGKDPAVAALEAMREDLREMETMIHRILEAARLRHGAAMLRPITLDLAALATEAAERLPADALDLRLPPHPVMLSADADMLAALLRNLLANALKHGASPTLGDTGGNAPKVQLTVREEDDDAVIEVRDHGPGIPENALPLIFQPFFRADPSRCRAPGDAGGGFGLGLNLCEAIVQAHGGGISACNAGDGGAIFTVRLPLRGIRTA